MIVSVATTVSISIDVLTIRESEALVLEVDS